MTFLFRSESFFAYLSTFCCALQMSTDNYLQAKYNTPLHDTHLGSLIRDHPFKTSACLRGGGVKNWQNLPTDSSKKLPTEGGRGQKSWKFADVLNGWSLSEFALSEDPVQVNFQVEIILKSRFHCAYIAYSADVRMDIERSIEIFVKSLCMFFLKQTFQVVYKKVSIKSGRINAKKWRKLKAIRLKFDS